TRDLSRSCTVSPPTMWPRSTQLIACFFTRHPAPTATYTLSLHDALPICPLHGVLHLRGPSRRDRIRGHAAGRRRDQHRQHGGGRSEEHTSELQSLAYLVCRLLLEKKNHLLAANAGESGHVPRLTLQELSG